MSDDLQDMGKRIYKLERLLKEILTFLDILIGEKYGGGRIVIELYNLSKKIKDTLEE